MEKQYKRNMTGELAKTALAVAFLVICSWLAIPLAVPITMQTYAVCVLSALTGRKNSAAAVLVYMLLCAVGAPVLAGFKGGLGFLLGSTGGYVAGFLLTAVCVSFAAHRFGRRPLPLAAAMAVGVLLCYALGTAWFVAVYARAGGVVSVGGVLASCVLPYIVPDAVKIWLAVVTVMRVGKYVA